MAINKKSLTGSKSATKPANTKSVKAVAPSPATAATALRTARSLSATTARAISVTTAMKAIDI